MDSTVGIVGMGLMGTSIAACILGVGHRVVCVESDAFRRRAARTRVLDLLRNSNSRGFIAASPDEMIQRYSVSQEFAALKDARIVLESTTENVASKRKVIRRIEEIVSPRTLIGTNTSAIPVTILQQGALSPGRIVGLHWAEPAHITRFMEIICGKKTLLPKAKLAMRLAQHWGKEPSLVRKDVRGFVTNRIMYAMLREAFHLVETGVATIADVDRSLRNDLGYWITFAGPFRFMDLTGIPAYEAVMEDLLPDLSRATKVPALMRKIVDSGAHGVTNSRGFYHYSTAQARRWQDAFLEFSYEIRALAQKYPEHLIDENKHRSRARKGK